MSKDDKDFPNQHTLTRSLNRGSLSRRDLIKLLSVGAVIGSGLPGFSASALAAEVPVKGGKMRAAMSNSSATDTLDPAKANNSADYTRQYMFYNGLTEINQTLVATPALATALQSDDGIRWQITLRKGVTFHNGKSLTADDVVWSLSRHKDPSVASSVFSLAQQFKTLTAVSPQQVEIVLQGPNFDLPLMLAMPAFLIVPADTTDFNKGIGTGPFVCQAFVPGLHTLGKRNTAYWKPGLPHLDDIELLGVPDQAARVNGLMSGDLHICSSISPDYAQRLKNSGGQFGVLESKSGMYTDLIIRTDITPGKNEDFVMAMKYLQPREMMVNTALLGYGTPGNDTPVPPWHPLYNADLKPRPIDTDKARFYLKKAGMSGASVEVVTAPTLDAAEEGALMMQNIARNAGLNINVRRVPYEGYWSTHWMKDPIGYGSVNPRPTVDLLFSQFYLSTAANNESKWHNPQFDQLVVAARGVRDEAKRKQMYGDMQTLIYNHCGTLVPVFVSSLDGYSHRVKGLASSPSGMMMGYRFHENVWLTA
ncbi:periplasmic component of an ABC superfamily dipeptide transporter [Tatumella ptyseos ATCC 33301]|uniref:Periplasmic component of an ABC superfamily dipeptide transporter n=2 Tax=Tatumella ptyseos TaxID=82987 RepID=A0A085JEU1_9GAMM|nr:ABC transporter substrate-binding protein [Tatumella ptyseos]KFD18987.1 periplasmic component of an ABC superfamily dipeptide transporter [Tatumella ptyseos ATCC 33301]SQK74857.1 Glutathione-binding protein gsiB precursor [Tatumella ptyseos]